LPTTSAGQFGDRRARLFARGPPASSGFLDGRSGIMLAQNDLPREGGEPPAWDACLLLTL
jgi:hypothetical protein